MKKENQIECNARLEVVRNGSYDDMYITLKDGTHFQVKLSFFNNKLLYKVKMYVNK